MALTVGNGLALQPGDVLLERFEWKMSHVEITVGQALGSVLRGQAFTSLWNRGTLGSAGQSKTVHSAIYTRDTPAGGMVAEMGVSTGVRENEIGPNRGNGRVEWKVYRFFNPAVVDMAVDVALELVKRSYEDANQGNAHQAYGSYTTRAAISAGLRSASTQPHGSAFEAVVQQRGFFCSNHTAACFAVASELLMGNAWYAIPKHMEKVNPAELDEYFKTVPGNWARLGGAQIYLNA